MDISVRLKALRQCLNSLLYKNKFPEKYFGLQNIFRERGELGSRVKPLRKATAD